MGVEKLTERILADAAAEAESIIADAQATADKIVAQANAKAEALRAETEAEVAEKRKSILEKRAAAARLDSAKILLAEKRKVIDAIYNEVLSRLLSLSKEDGIRLISSLLAKYAEKGDEIFFAENFPYADEVKALPVFTEKELTVAEERLPISGGIRLKGRLCDKDLSFDALLHADREDNQAEIAKELFK